MEPERPTPLRFSVAVPCRDGMPYLREALDSITRAQPGVDVEVLLHDGGSTDGSVDVARAMLGRDRVVAEPDDGQHDAINRAWRRSTGDVLSWLNADDRLEPGALAVVARAFAAHPEAQWCVGHYRIIDAEGRPTRRIHVGYKHWLLRHYSRSLLLVENLIPQMSVFLRRSLWARAGDLGSAYGAFDYEYWLRLSALAPPLVLRDALAAFRWHPRSKTGRDPGRIFREELDVCRRHTDSRVLRGLHAVAYYRNRWLYDLVRW